MFFRYSVRLILEWNVTRDRLTLSLSLAHQRAFPALNVTKTIASREIEPMLSIECSYQWHLFDIRFIYFRRFHFLTFSKMWKRTSMTSFDNCRWVCSSLLIDPSYLSGKLISIDKSMKKTIRIDFLLSFLLFDPISAWRDDLFVADRMNRWNVAINFLNKISFISSNKQFLLFNERLSIDLVTELRDLWEGHEEMAIESNSQDVREAATWYQVSEAPMRLPDRPRLSSTQTLLESPDRRVMSRLRPLG